MAIVPHRSTASASTRSATRGRSPASVVDITAEQLPKVHQQATQVEQATLLVELHQEVDIAGRRPVPTSDRTEHPDPVSVPSFIHADDLLTGEPGAR